MRGKEREREREGGGTGKQTKANEKQLTSFPCRGLNIKSGRSIRCSSVYVFNYASGEVGGGGRKNGRMKWKG